MKTVRKGELLWFLSGDTKIKWRRTTVTLWDGWADADGNLGPVYGPVALRPAPDGRGIDQVIESLKSIRTPADTSCRRGIGVALMPCHVMFQFCGRQPSVVST